MTMGCSRRVMLNWATECSVNSEEFKATSVLLASLHNEILAKILTELLF